MRGQKDIKGERGQWPFMLLASSRSLCYSDFRRGVGGSQNPGRSWPVCVVFGRDGGMVNTAFPILNVGREMRR